MKDKEILIIDIENMIQQYDPTILQGFAQPLTNLRIRIACETVQFVDFDFAAKHDVESVLWDAHTLINNRYRKIIQKLKASEPKKSVERRKWDKRYADYLKTSQFYYKGFIQRMASQFEGLKELRIIAHRLALDTLSVDRPFDVSAETEKHILSSCHFALLRLGDLYRYRNEINVKERSWEKAQAHYALANDLCPDTGSAFNQMAVISLADGNHLDAVYNLYRALAVNDPHPLAANNLEIEFKKINSLWVGGGPKKHTTPAAPAPKTPTENMVLWFVRLHAKLYKGEEFSSHDELENEVLSQMTVLLKEQSLEDILDKIVLINIAAEYFAGVRLTAGPTDEIFRAYYFYLRLNVRMLFMLLQLLQPELDFTQGDESPDVTGKFSSTRRLSAVTRRILAALRQYSTWLVATAPVIASQIGFASINVHIKEMWSMYCSTLSLLKLAFPEQLSDVDYLQEEDAATVGFKPFRDSAKCHLYTNQQGQMKPRSTDPQIQRFHPNIEMEARIKDILEDGKMLANTTQDGRNAYPVYLIDGQFRFIEDGLSEPSPRASPLPEPLSWNYQIEPEYSHGQPFQHSQNYEIPLARPPSVEPSESQQSLTREMHQMVDDLLTPSKAPHHPQQQYPTQSRETSYGMHTSTAFELLNNVHMPSEPHPHASRRRASGFPNGPGFPSGLTGFSSPFWPPVGELGAQYQEPSRVDGFRTDIHQLAQAPPNMQQQRQSSIPRQANYDSLQHSAGPPGSGGAAPTRRVSPQHNVAQELQASLAAQFQSSGFSNQSSIYQNTPSYAHIQLGNQNSNCQLQNGRPAQLQQAMPQPQCNAGERQIMMLDLLNKK